MSSTKTPSSEVRKSAAAYEANEAPEVSESSSPDSSTSPPPGLCAGNAKAPSLSNRSGRSGNLNRSRTRVGRAISAPSADSLRRSRVGQPNPDLPSLFAKTYPAFGGQLNWFDLTPERRARALALTPIQEIWGIGGRTAEKLGKMGVESAADFLKIPSGSIRRIFGVVLERTHLELQGVECLPLEPTPKQRLQICRSQSFGEPCFGIEDIKASLATHIAESARVLRRESLTAKRLRIYFFTDPFRTDLPSYAADVERVFLEPTNDVLELTTAALDLVDRVFRKGFAYKKAGIILTDLVGQQERDAERSLFVETESDLKKERSRELMATLDGLEKRFGKGTVVPAAALLSSRWRMKQDRKSRCFTTRWDELIETAP